MEGDAPEFTESFPDFCRPAGISCEPIAIAEARKIEPLLSEKLFKAYKVPDATIDPFRLALLNVAHARALKDSMYRPHTEVLRFTIENGKITEAICRDNRTHSLVTIRASQYVNASGAWAMNIAQLAGCRDFSLLYSKGTLLVSHDRLTTRVINRLRPPSDGDILVPGGTVSVLGTTSVRVDDLDSVKPTMDEIDKNIREGTAMIPALATARYIRAFSRVRPLLQSTDSSDDSLSLHDLVAQLLLLEST